MNLINIKEAAAQTSLKESYIRYLVLTKRIPHYKIGKLVRIDVADLTKFIIQHKQEIRI
jgi:excisionase family DNA binding protein